MLPQGFRNISDNHLASLRNFVIDRPRSDILQVFVVMLVVLLFLIKCIIKSKAIQCAQPIFYYKYTCQEHLFWGVLNFFFAKRLLLKPVEKKIKFGLYMMLVLNLSDAH